MFLIELNEYNREMLQRLCAVTPLPNIENILTWQHCATYTPDLSSSGFLDPWCQWVSVHTGQPSSQHQLKNLGDVPSKATKQLWEHWSDRGESSVVWGVMNASRAKANGCIAFIPDPWTFTEDAFPARYQGLISLPRYLSKNYLSPSKRHLVKESFGLLWTGLRSTKARDWYHGAKILASGARQFGKAHLTSIVLFEYFSAMAFLRAIERFKPDHSILFLNMLAHAQHHYWIDKDPSKSPQLIYVAKVIDEIIGNCLAAHQSDVKGQQIAMLNAISQKNTNDEPAWILYVPKSHAEFLNIFDIGSNHVEPLMTNDAHVFFETEEAADRGERRLRALEIHGKPLLHVERHSSNRNQIFYKGIFSQALDANDIINCENISVPFFEYFTKIVQRTGRHVQEGDILSNMPNMPKTLEITEIFDFLNANKAKNV